MNTDHILEEVGLLWLPEKELDKLRQKHLEVKTSK